jgi:citrate lyase beta subunit/acyl dehydratase
MFRNRGPADVSEIEAGKLPLLRSWMFLASEKLAAMQDPGRFGADVLVLDLEDSVLPSQKEGVRQRIAGAVEARTFAKMTVVIRINALVDSEDLQRDLEVCGIEGITGFVLPMVDTAADVERFEEMLVLCEESRSLPVGTFKVIPLLETPSGILHAEPIARASSRNIALGFGHADLMNITESVNSTGALLVPRTIVVLAARAAGLVAIETPYLQVSKPHGFERACQEAKDLGFSAMWLIHPTQVQPANRIFSPSPTEVRWAEGILTCSADQVTWLSPHGEMIGPPTVAKAKSILVRHPGNGAPPAEDEGVIGHTPRYGVNLDEIRVGQMLESPHELTIDESWRTTWQGSFHTPALLTTSARFAEQLGFSTTPLPLSLVLNLALCMSVEPFSENCLLHLGLHEVTYIRPVHAGDTLRNYIRVDELRNIANGKQSVIKTTHWLVNQHDEPVFSLVKMSFYPSLAGLENREAEQGPLDPVISAPVQGEDTPLRNIIVAAGAAVAPPTAAHSVLKPGQLFLHQRVRPIGVTENLYLTTLLRNTHPVHSDYQAFQPEEIIICGGFVMAMVQAATSRELRQILDEEIVQCSHVNRVTPGDNIGAISYVIDVEPFTEHLEWVTVKTLGLKNIDVATELADVAIPRELLQADPLKPSAIESICAARCTFLARRIALQMTRKLLRPLS